MKINKKVITGLLVILTVVSCIPVDNTVPTERVIPTSTITVPVPTNTAVITPTATLSPIERNSNGILALNSEGKVFFYDFNGVILHQVGSEKGWITRSTVSPTRDRIAYSLAPTTHGLIIRELYGKQEIQVAGPETRILFFTWAGDGDSLLYATIDGIYRYSFDPPSEKIIPLSGVIESPTESFFRVHPSPDGQSFIVEQSVYNENTFHVYFVSIPQKAIIKLNDIPYNSSSIDNEIGGWVKNGGYFYYSADTSQIGSNMRNQQTFVFDATSLALVDGFPNPYPLAWSPDGGFVAQSQRQNRRTILLNNGDFSAGWNEVYSISSTGGNEFNNMAWSPDSRSLAISLIDHFSPSMRQLYLFTPQDNQMETLVDAVDIVPAELFWSPGGNHLLIADSETGVTYPDKSGICQFQIYSFVEDQLMNVPDVDCYGIISSGWSTDGKVFAFTTYSTYTQDTKTLRLYFLEMETASVKSTFFQDAYFFEVIR